MDKQLLKAYIRTIVEEEVTRILPQMLSEAVSQVKQLKENVTPTKNAPKFDRNRLSELMGVSYDGHTIQATTNNLPSRLPDNAPADADPEVVKAITKDYSAIMKALKLT